MNSLDNQQITEPECQVKMFFDEEDNSNQVNTTDFSSGIVIKDHFIKAEGGNSSNKNSASKGGNQIADDHRNSLRQVANFEDNEDGFSEILNDNEAMRLRRQTMA